MKYEEDLNKTNFVIDERNFINAMTLIKDIIGEDFNIEFKNDNDFVRFMNSPGDFIDNEDIVNKIKDLKELLNIMEDIYHV
ncbi:hypothetical protein KQI41_18675 [Tissierella pigra]|uniref:hypothetical protein n=1 Tax=Tissierella pigra TaxID=2607614 RepID=UPI001C118FF8|nr:hypothetical protein [Tissierella pigra]MBU5428418.1 hypothetical protein [Tissierella pigra]